MGARALISVWRKNRNGPLPAHAASPQHLSSPTRGFGCKNPPSCACCRTLRTLLDVPSSNSAPPSFVQHLAESCGERREDTNQPFHSDGAMKRSTWISTIASAVVLCGGLILTTPAAAMQDEVGACTDVYLCDNTCYSDSYMDVWCSQYSTTCTKGAGCPFVNATCWTTNVNRCKTGSA